MQYASNTMLQTAQGWRNQSTLVVIVAINPTYAFLSLFYIIQFTLDEVEVMLLCAAARCGAVRYMKLPRINYVFFFDNCVRLPYCTAKSKHKSPHHHLYSKVRYSNANARYFCICVSTVEYFISKQSTFLFVS